MFLRASNKFWMFFAVPGERDEPGGGRLEAGRGPETIISHRLRFLFFFFSPLPFCFFLSPHSVTAPIPTPPVRGSWPGCPVPAARHYLWAKSMRCVSWGVFGRAAGKRDSLPLYNNVVFFIPFTCPVFLGIISSQVVIAPSPAPLPLTHLQSVA